MPSTHFCLKPLAVGLMLLAMNVSAATLTPTETHIVAAVKARSDAALQLLERSARINSGTMNHEGVKAVGAVFREELEGLGFRTRWAEMPAAMQRAGHLIAEHEGNQGKRVLLIGHLDTVFEKDSKVPLWERHGERVHGQGVYDMKGGDVIIIEALRALKAAGALDNTRIQVIFSGDEEKAGSPVSLSRADMINAAKNSDVALAFEATVRQNGQETATVGRRASGGFLLEVQGKQGHSAGIFSQNAGYGAIYETARILNSFREELIEPDLTFNVGNILGGTDVQYSDAEAGGKASGKNNVIARSAVAKGDLRYLSAEQRDKTYAKMRDIVARNLPGTSARISFTEAYPPMAPTPGNYRLLQMYSDASADAGLGNIAAIAPGERGAGDIQFVAPYVDSLDGLGAAGKGAHSPEEELEIASLQRSTIRTALMLYRLTR